MAEQQLFFATREDLLHGLRRFEERARVRYFRAGLFESPEPQCFPSAKDIPNIGVLRGRRVQKPIFLVMPADVNPSVRAVPQRRGGELYAVDGVANHGAITLELGGTMEDCLIYGTVQGGLEHEDSVRLWNAFSEHFFASFRKKKVFLLGPDAMRVFEEGGRLTSSPKADPTMDLA
jgi:hypothetical protein